MFPLVNLSTISDICHCMYHAQPFARVGKKGSVVKVNAGWMRHQLFPRGWAVYATPENVEQHRMVSSSDVRQQGAAPCLMLS